MTSFRVFPLICAFFSLLACGCSTASTFSEAQSTTNATGSPGLVFLNAYNASVSYVPTDVVTYLGSSYVALTAIKGVPPTGSANSATSWAVLAQAGTNGAQGISGIQGVPGLTGPQGAPGVAGLRGSAGVPGTQGVVGPAGSAGATGATGPVGPVGPIGPPGPTGPTGATGPTGPAGQSAVSFLQSRNFGVLGDSISDAYRLGFSWQNVVMTRTGMSLALQDARGGRTFATAFECYGTSTPGTTPGIFHYTYNTNNCHAAAGTDGNTLAQNLAPVDLEVIELGTNDYVEPLGALGDSTSANTFYGDVRWVVETLLTTKPSLRIVLVTPELNGFQPASVTQQYVQALVNYGASMGLPVVNMFALGGLNPLTVPTLTVDQTHPNAFNYANFYGPVVAQALQQIF